MGLGGAISNLLSLGSKLLPAINGSAQAPWSSSLPPIDQNHQIEAELERLMRLLERIRATLYDAEQREIIDLSIKLWLKELKGVAYDAEDVLGEYHYELLQAQVETRDASSSDSRKRKLIQVPYGMLDHIKQIRSRFDEIMNDRIALQLPKGDGPKRCNNELQVAPSSHFVVELNIFGRERENKKLIDLLSSECDVVSVVTIVGMGGIGKTTLAQLAYNDQRIRQMFDKFGWICVSNDFNVKRLTRELIESITGEVCDLTNLSAIQEKIQKEISAKRVLLVLDDVWNEKKNLWDQFQAPFLSAAFAKILVTTRNNHVARIMQTEQTFPLGNLSAQQGWRLFKHYAFGGVDQNHDPKLVEIGKQIMNKCGMLPLAMKSIASLLRYEGEEKNWRDILESELWESDASNEIFPPLQISYARLPTYLKVCFLYCSMFPKDHEYNVEELVKLWKYQGFIESKENKSAEDIGFEYAEQLCQRSLFEREGIYQGNGFVQKKFKLHDIVHDLARLNSENGCYSTEVGKLPIFHNVVYHLYIPPYVNLIDLFPSNKFTSLRTLILHSSSEILFNTFDLSMVPKLRALKIDGSYICEFLSTVGNLKHLRYLSLNNDLFFETLPEYICSLYSLQNLTLKGIDNLKELPTKIENLISLEELIIDNCSPLEVLPESLCQLKALKKLFIISSSLEVLPNNIGNLVSLEELQIVSCDDLQLLPESLCQLKALKKLFIISSSLEVLPNNIGNLVSLEELQIVSCDDLQLLPESLSKLNALRKLRLIVCDQIEELPNEMGSLTNIQTLEIRDTGVSYLPPSLSKLLGIKSLKVELECKAIGWLKDFPNLGGALALCGLENISNLMDVQCINLVSMCNLQYLILSWDGGWYYTREIDGNVLDLTIKSGQNMFPEYQSCFSVMVCLQPHPKLSKLQIRRYSGIIFPEWIGSLSKLLYLKITSCHSLQFLKAESLPLQLEELEIDGCYQLVSMHGIQMLKSLVKLSINYCQNLHSVIMQPSLELTMCTLEGSYESSSSGLTNLASLRRLQISSCLKLQVLGDELLPVGPCKVEVSNCPGLREWCMLHGINYKG